MPVFETTPDAVKATADKTISDGNAVLDGIGQLRPNEVNFANTIRQLDDLGYLVQRASDRLGLIEQTSTNAAVRDAATDAIKKLSDWSVGTDYREDVYAAVKAYAATQPVLVGEDKKLFRRNAARLSPRRFGFAEGPARRGGKIAQAVDRDGNGF